MGILLNSILVITFAFLPILGWAYAFSYLDNTPLHAKRFFTGIIAGGLSVIPVLYLEDILGFFGLENYDILKIISKNLFEPLMITFGLLTTILIVGFFMFLAGFTFMNELIKTYKTYLKNLLTLCLFSLIFLIAYYVVSNIGFFDKTLAQEVTIGKNIFNTFGLITLYYIIVGLLEESSKHFAFIPSSLDFASDVKKGLVLCVFVALGFGFIENILYLFNISNESGFSGEALTTSIFRGIFSLFVHILSSVIVTKGFMEIYVKSKKTLVTKQLYAKAFLVAITVSIAIHAIYDISLTVGFTGIIFIYFIIGYLFITKCFYKEN